MTQNGNFLPELIDEELQKLQQDNKLQSGHPTLKRYVTDSKQILETTVMPSSLTDHIMTQAHDKIGHNGLPRTCMFLR